MDPPDLREKSILERIPALDADLQKLYLKFLEKKPDKPCEMRCYRNKQNLAEDDANFDVVKRYEGSHPLENFFLRHTILAEFNF